MKIETFNELLKAKNPNGYAFVPDKQDKRQTAISVVFEANGKAYTYQGTILSVAERIGLVPEIDINAEAQKATDELIKNGHTTTYLVCRDTITHLLGQSIRVISKFDDEFSRSMAVFEIAPKSEWL